MQKSSLIILIIAVILSFAGGFFLANSINKKEISALQSEVGKLKSNEPVSDNQNTLTDEEIAQKISEADKQPENLEFQKNLAIALYRYASMRQETKYLPEIARLMTRVYDKNPNDYDPIIFLGSVYFDLGAGKSDNENLKKAREFYQKALTIKPKEVDVQTNLGVIYLISTPAEPEKAIIEFQKSLQINPKHEKTLQNIVQAKIGVGKSAEAEQFLQKLKEVNPKNEAIAELSAKLEQSKTK